MAIILHIDTAVETASVCLSGNGEILGLSVNENQKDHASWLHNAMRVLVKDAGFTLKDLEAVAVSIGPGSYTGLRVGLSAAKGLCFALNIPLIPVGTLEMMAHSIKNEATDLICPLVDARRMEVFTAVYNKSLIEIIKPCTMIIDTDSFSEVLSLHKIIFLGNGSKKLQTILSNNNAEFSFKRATAADMAPLADTLFRGKKFADLAYTEPFYIKEFYSPAHLLSK